MKKADYPHGQSAQNTITAVYVLTAFFLTQYLCFDNDFPMAVRTFDFSRRTLVIRIRNQFTYGNAERVSDFLQRIKLWIPIGTDGR